MKKHARTLALIPLVFALSACRQEPDPANQPTTPDTAVGAAPAETAGADGAGQYAADAQDARAGTPQSPPSGHGASTQDMRGQDAQQRSGSAGTQAAQGQDAAALGVLNAINAHEIAAGEQALRKNVGGEVARYAQMMIDQHTQNREQTNALGPDQNAADAKAQRDKSTRELAALDKAEGDAYARAYVDAMVKDHGEALQMLDSTLIPGAGSPQVRQHLTTTRAHVARHLEEAKALQQGSR